MSDDIMARAIALMRKKNFSGCVALLCDASGRLTPLLKEDQRHDAWYLIGDSQFMLGNYDGALSAFHMAQKYRPGDRDTLFAIGNCHSHLGSAERAKWYFGLLADLNKKDSAAWFNLGNAFVDLGNDTEAIKCFVRVLKSKTKWCTLAKKNIDKIKKRRRVSVVQER